MDYKDLKRCDVIVFRNYGDIIGIFNKIEKDSSGGLLLYTYVELVDKTELFFEKYESGYTYILEDIQFRLATEEEKYILYNAICKYFTDEYDKDWYNHFTDSSYFDVQDFLFDMFNIKVEEYDNDMIYPDFINDIHTYIWNKLCKAMGYKPYVNEFTEQLVNYKDIVEKTIKYFTPILKTYCSEDCVKELIDGFVNSMKR